MSPDATAQRPAQPLAEDLTPLLAPIPGESPAGADLRYAGLYDEVQEARREDDPSLPQGVWKTALKRADWNRVAALCSEALAHRSKDLQLAVWLLEAWLHLHGTAGVAQGVQLLHDLCESFWETLHPRLAGDDSELRLAPLHWMDEKLAVRVNQVAVTAPESAEALAYSLLDWEAARYRENLARTQSPVASPGDSEEPSGVATLPRFQMSVTLTPSPFFAAALDDARFAADTVTRLADLLARRCGDRAPTLRRFRDNLEAVAQLALRVLSERADRGEDVFPPPELPVSFAAGPEDEEPVSFPAGGPIRSRADAYRRLSEAADYLLRTEPHSPAPYLVHRAVSWGGLTLAELLQELLANKSDIATLYALLGIREGH